MNKRITTKDIANFTEALTKAFDLLDNARMNISRTENAKLLCQCHYLTNENYTDSREAFCPSDFNGSFCFGEKKTDQNVFFGFFSDFVRTR